MTPGHPTSLWAKKPRTNDQPPDPPLHSYTRQVDIVRYPGLASFPQKALADAQHGNGIHGSMLWFEVTGGTEAGRKLMNSVQRPWSLCENLGATESILTCPAVMTHANMLQEDR